MDAVLNWLWQGVVVAGAAAAMLRLLDRSRAAIRCVVCWVALLVVVTLPFVPAAMAALASGAPTISTAVSTGAPLVIVPNTWWTSSTLVAALWMIWAGIYAVRIVGAVIAVRRARANSQPFPGVVAAALPYWQRVRGQGRRTRLVLSDRVRAAAVLGGGAPVIAVARTLVGGLDANELDRVVIHEWAHVQRRDDLTNIGQLIVRAVAGWHPAVWWLDRRLSIEQELACDEVVVAVSGGAKTYAACLVKLASRRPTQRDVLLAAGALSSAGIARRVARLVTRKDFASSTWSRRAAATGVLILFVLALGIAPVRVVEAAVSTAISAAVSTEISTAVARVLQPAGQSATAQSTDTVTRRPEFEGRERRQSAPPSAAARQMMAGSGQGASGPEAQAPHTQAEAVEATEVAPAPEPRTPPVLDAAAGPLPTSPPPVVVTSPPQVADGSPSAWSPATDAGEAIGRGSKNAGVATAGVFTRFAKRIAGSF